MNYLSEQNKRMDPIGSTFMCIWLHLHDRTNELKNELRKLNKINALKPPTTQKFTNELKENSQDKKTIENIGFSMVKCPLNAQRSVLARLNATKRSTFTCLSHKKD